MLLDLGWWYCCWGLSCRMWFIARPLLVVCLIGDLLFWRQLLLWRRLMRLWGLMCLRLRMILLIDILLIWLGTVLIIALWHLLLCIVRELLQCILRGMLLLLLLVLLLLLLLPLVKKRPGIGELGVGVLQLGSALRLLLEGQVKHRLRILILLARLVIGSPSNVEGGHLATSSSLKKHLVEMEWIRLHGYVLQPQPHQTDILAIVVIVLIHRQAALQSFAVL